MTCLHPSLVTKSALDSYRLVLERTDLMSSIV